MVSYRDVELPTTELPAIDKGYVEHEAPTKKTKTIPTIIFSLAMLAVVALSSDMSLSFSSDARRRLEGQPKPTGKVRRGTQTRSLEKAAPKRRLDADSEGLEALAQMTPYESVVPKAKRNLDLMLPKVTFDHAKADETDMDSEKKAQLEERVSSNFRPCRSVSTIYYLPTIIAVASSHLRS